MAHPAPRLASPLAAPRLPPATLRCLAGGAALAALLLAGCAEPGAPGDLDGAAPRELAFTTIEGCDAQGSEEQYLVLRDEAAWRAFWEASCAPSGPGAADAQARDPPPVDFARHSVVAAFWGEKPTGGFAIEVTGIRQRADGADVAVRRDAPGAGCGAITVLTYPHHLVRAERIAGESAFSFTDREVPC